MSNAVVPLHAEEDGIYTPRKERSRYPSTYSSIDLATSMNQSRSSTAGRINTGVASTSSSVRRSHPAAAAAPTTGMKPPSAEKRDTVLTDSLKKSSLTTSGNGIAGKSQLYTPPSTSAAATKVPPHASSAPRPGSAARLANANATTSVTARPVAASSPPVRPPASTVGAPLTKSPAVGVKPSPLVYKKPANPREALAAAEKAEEAPPTPARSVTPQRKSQVPLLPFGPRSPSTSPRTSLTTDRVSTSGPGRPVRTLSPGKATVDATGKPHLAAAVQAFNERLNNPRPVGSRATSSLSSSTTPQSRPTPATSPAPRTSVSAPSMASGGVATTSRTPSTAAPAAAAAPTRSTGISPTLTNSTLTSSSSRGSGDRVPSAPSVPRAPTNANTSVRPSTTPPTTTTAAAATPANTAAHAPVALPFVKRMPTPLARPASQGTTASTGSGATAVSVSQQRRVTVPTAHTQRTPPSATTPTGSALQNGRVMAHPYPNATPARPSVPTTTAAKPVARTTSPATTSTSTSSSSGNGNGNGNGTVVRTTPPAATGRPSPPVSSANTTARKSLSPVPPAQPPSAAAKAAPQRRVSSGTEPSPPATVTKPPSPQKLVVLMPTPKPVNTPATATTQSAPSRASSSVGARPSPSAATTPTPAPTTTATPVPTTMKQPLKVSATPLVRTSSTASVTSTSSARKNGAEDDVVATTVLTRRTNTIKPVSPSRANDPERKAATTEVATPLTGQTAAPARGARQRGPGSSPSHTANGTTPTTATTAGPKPGPSLLSPQRGLDELTDVTSSLDSNSKRFTSKRNSASGSQDCPPARLSPVSSPSTGGGLMKFSQPGRNTVASTLLDSPTSGVGLPSFGTSDHDGPDDEDDDDEEEEHGGNVGGSVATEGPKTPRAARRETRRQRPHSSGARKRSDSADKKHKKKAVSSAEELATLAQYLDHEELNLSMSTFNSVQILAESHALRVLNLKGSTLSSEGLRGLGRVRTLQSLCVSHMRRLRSLVPLITTDDNSRCALQEIDAQCTPLDDKGIYGLDKLPRLVKLDLSMTGVTDVSVLSGSRSLRELYVSVTRVTNAGIMGLEKIPTLTMLNLSRTKVTSVENIAKSHSIDTLILYSCKVDDAGLRGVASMPRLVKLDVSTTKVTNLSVLETSRSLKVIKAQWLALKNCCDIIQERRQQMDRAALESSGVLRSEQEAGYSGLAKIPTLEIIDLSFNTIRSVSTLCASKSLKRLILRRTRVDNKGIEQIDKLSRTLEELVVTNITDGADESEEELSSLGSGATAGTVSTGMLSSVLNLAGLAHLAKLDLSFTDVFDLRMLQILKHLKELFIVETLVTVDGLRGIELIPTLEVLDLSQTSVMSLQFLVSGAKALRKIVVRSNRNVRGFRLGHLENLPRLEHLDMSDTVVEDVRLMWTSAWDLKELIWRWKERREASGLVPALECWVTSERLMGISKLPSLTMLDLSNSSVHNLQFLEGSRVLQTLTLDGSRLLRDDCVTSIATCRALEVVDLSNIPHITAVSGLTACPKLKELRLANTAVTGSGVEGLTQMPEMKTLDIANTPAEEEMMQAMGDKAATASQVNGVNMNNSFSYTRPQSRMMEESSLADVSMMDTSATPAQFRVPRRRRVSFVGGEAPSK